MKAEIGKVDYEESRKRPRDNSQSSGLGNQRRRVFIPYSAVPRAPNAPKSSGYAPRPQTPNNAGGTNYRPAMGTPGSGACFTCGQPGHYMKECPHNTSVCGAPPPKKFTKPQFAGRQLPGAPRAVDAAGGLDPPRRPWPPINVAADQGRNPFSPPPPFLLLSAPGGPNPSPRPLAVAAVAGRPKLGRHHPSSAVLPRFSSTKRRPRRSSPTRQSDGARPAGHRTSPPTPASPRLAVGTTSFVVSFEPIGAPPLLDCFLYRPRTVRSPGSPRELAGDAPPATNGGRRRPILVRGDAARLRRPPAPPPEPSGDKAVVDLQGQAMADVVMTSP
nr:formin-like protein 3 [Lolium perenne]